MPVLDASFLIDMERGHSRAASILAELHTRGERLLVPAQAAAEFLTGIEDSAAGLHHLQASFIIVDFGPNQVLEAARLAEVARRKGRHPGWADIQIAATAALEETFILTANPTDFRDLGCRVVDYRKGELPN